MTEGCNDCDTLSHLHIHLSVPGGIVDSEVGWALLTCDAYPSIETSPGSVFRPRVLDVPRKLPLLVEMKYNPVVCECTS